MPQVKQQSIQEIIEDNLMSHEQILSYIKDDFRVDLNKIRKIVILDQYSHNNFSSYKRIPHHRYCLYFDEVVGDLFIQPTEGKLRSRHIEIESKILASLIGKPIDFVDLSHPLENRIINWEKGLQKLLSGKGIDGVLIGSLWNFNFYLKLLANSNFAKRYTQNLDQVILNKYVVHQLTLIVIEHEYINNGLFLEEFEKSIFQEGNIPNLKTIEITRRISRKIHAFEDKVSFLRKRKDLIEYINTDYLFFKDIEERTSTFKKTLVSKYAKIVHDPLLNYQLITINDSAYINFSWANAEVLNIVLKRLEEHYNFNSFYMYGKCGSISTDFKIGQLVIPIRSYSNKTFTNIYNQVQPASGISGTNFIHVNSPLLETRRWAKEAIQSGCDCVDMELDPVVRALSKHVAKKILYYISDQPTLGLTLSDRLSLITQRLDCCKIIVNDILLQTKN